MGSHHVATERFQDGVFSDPGNRRSRARRAQETRLHGDEFLPLEATGAGKPGGGATEEIVEGDLVGKSRNPRGSSIGGQI